ncbi:hypothetical protein LQ50_15770 [Halalkalibacter okhensis]|uniref:N-acetyltransferase domain-containing protein n=1 Tax=Halalkalibacter okhensis TaxID=333138 RepID=A0A0B0IA08_9BACI|nr:hypothetical protein LQ50_15770 [Halalkalibacter okhensis]
MNCKIRRAELSDLSSLSELFVELTEHKTNQYSMKEQFEIISNNPNYFVVVAVENEAVVGTAMGILCNDLVGNCNTFLLVENVVVAPSCRGKGIGQMLMRSLEEFGNRNKCNYVILVSNQNRDDAHSFYEKFGYQKQLGFKKRLNTQV